MTRVFAAGTFDGLHDGHRDYFRQAREHGDSLIVVVARDATVKRIKGRHPRRSETDRLAAVAAEPLVDEALLGHAEEDRFAILRTLRPDVVFLGYDQPVSEGELRVALDAAGLSGTAIVRGEPYIPERYKSSILDNVQTRL